MDQVASLPPSSFTAERGERAILHEEIEQLRSGDESLDEFFELPTDQSPANKIKLSDIHFDLAIERADEVYDGFVRALSIQSHQEQAKEFQKLDREYEVWAQKSDEKSLKLIAAGSDGLSATSRWIGETMAMSLRPWYWQRRVSDDRAKIRRDLVCVGMALVAYYADHDHYPNELNQLAPHYLPEVPLDAFTDSPFLYRRASPHQAHLTSWGANRQDDSGRFSMMIITLTCVVPEIRKQRSTLIRHVASERRSKTIDRIHPVPAT